MTALAVVAAIVLGLVALPFVSERCQPVGCIDDRADELLRWNRRSTDDH